MAITPDTKDWTWVLDRSCDECGFDVRSPDRASVAALLRLVSQRWVDVLERADVRSRPSPDRWSPLEYACHVRDVCTIYDGRVRRMLDERDPLYANWDQDATAVAQRYNDQNPATVAVELATAAGALAARFEATKGSDWARAGRRSDGASFTVESIARYFIHDLIHHLHDVGHPLQDDVAG